MKSLVRVVALFSMLLLLLTGCGSEKNVSEASTAAGSSGDSISEESQDTPKAAEGYDILGGQQWEVGGVFYRNSIVNIHDNAGLEDMYDSTYLDFEDDGTFLYSYHLFRKEGSYKKYEGDGAYDYYLLKAEKSTRFDVGKGEFVETEASSNGETTYIITILDDNTIEFEEYDSITGSAKANETPLIFVKGGSESQYISGNGTGTTTGSGGSSKPTDNSQKTGSDSTVADFNGSYQAILDDYTAQMNNAVTRLVKEYKAESAGISDINQLAEICNDKISDLADICMAGVGEMADLMYANGDSSDTYEKWAGKLQDNYSDIASEIQDAYMDSAMN